MTLSARELKKKQDDERLIAIWRDWHAKELADVIAGPHGAVVTSIMAKIARLDPANGAALVTAVEGVDWRLVDAQVRLVLFHEINSAIADLRSHHGLAVISDPLPGQTLSVFQRVKAALFPSQSVTA